MKHNYVLSIFSLFILCTSYAQTTAIPDQSFEQALIDLGIDSDGVVNGEVLTVDIADVTTLTIDRRGITDVTGIGDFTSLEYLRCSENDIVNLDLTGVINLRELISDFGKIQTVNLNESEQLEFIDLSHNEIVEIDLSQNVNLQTLYIGNPSVDSSPFNLFEVLDLSNNILLEDFRCKFCFNLTDLNLSNLSILEILDVGQSGLTSLDTSDAVNLKSLTTGYQSDDFENVITPLVQLDLSNNVNLETFRMPYTTIRSVNIQNGMNDLLATFDARQNDALECILVDDENAAAAGQAPYDTWNIPDAVTFSETECVLSVEENELEIVTLYPNPTQDDTTLEGITNIALKAIHLYDVAGRKVSTQSDITVISMRELPVGIYFAKLQLENGKALTKRIVKQ